MIGEYLFFAGMWLILATLAVSYTVMTINAIRRRDVADATVGWMAVVVFVFIFGGPLLDWTVSFLRSSQ